MIAASIQEPIDFPASALSALIDCFPIPMVVTDSALRMVFVNRTAEGLLGYDRDEVLGGHVGTLIPLTDPSRQQDLFPRRAAVGEAAAAQARAGAAANNRECLLTDRRGRSFPAQVSSFPVFSEVGRYFGVLIRDLTEDRERAQEQKKTRRLADLGKAISLIAHEIRKRLTLIGGFAQQLSGSSLASGSASATAKLKIIVDEVSALERMLNGVRLIGRLPEPSARRMFDLNELIRETLELMHPLCERLPVQVRTELAADPVTIWGDADLLKQVLLNLLHNALDALAGKGWIQVRSERRGETEVIVSIDDNGVGIPRDLAERVFDPFFTTKVGGSGLGLAICRNIIEDHGGRIFFRSGRPQGTTFVVELPLHSGLPNIP